MQEMWLALPFSSKIDSYTVRRQLKKDGLTFPECVEILIIIKGKIRCLYGKKI